MPLYQFWKLPTVKTFASLIYQAIKYTTQWLAYFTETKFEAVITPIGALLIDQPNHEHGRKLYESGYGKGTLSRGHANWHDRLANRETTSTI